MMDAPDYRSFFVEYTAAYERSLGDSVDVQAIRAFFAESFVSAGVDGKVRAGANDDTFERTLQQAYAFYKAIGTRGMKLDRVEAQGLYPNHDRVQVYYRAEYEKADGSRVTIPFDLVYLLQRRADGPKIFGFIAGDESALFRQHGLIDDEGNPVSRYPPRAT